MWNQIEIGIENENWIIFTWKYFQQNSKLNSFFIRLFVSRSSSPIDICKWNLCTRFNHSTSFIEHSVIFVNRVDIWNKIWIKTYENEIKIQFSKFNGINAYFLTLFCCAWNMGLNSKFQCTNGNGFERNSDNIAMCNHGWLIQFDYYFTSIIETKMRSKPIKFIIYILYIVLKQKNNLNRIWLKLLSIVWILWHYWNFKYIFTLNLVSSVLFASFFYRSPRFFMSFWNEMEKWCSFLSDYFSFGSQDIQIQRHSN